MMSVQSNAYPLAGLLSKVKVQTLAFLSMLNLSKPDIKKSFDNSTRTRAKVFSGSLRETGCLSVCFYTGQRLHAAKRARKRQRANQLGSNSNVQALRASVKPRPECMQMLTFRLTNALPIEFSDSIKKGSTTDATLLTTDTSYQPCGYCCSLDFLRWRRSTLTRKALRATSTIKLLMTILSGKYGDWQRQRDHHRVHLRVRLMMTAIIPPVSTVSTVVKQREAG